MSSDYGYGYGGGGAPGGGRGRGGPRGGRGGRGGPSRGGYDSGYGRPAPGGGDQNYNGYGDSYSGYGEGYGAPYGPGQQYALSPLEQDIQRVIGEMHNELLAINSAGEWAETLKNARRLLQSERERLEANEDPEWIEVDIDKPIRVSKKVLIPTFRHPRFNFVGKVLGPKGATLQNLSKTHKCHIYILGRQSTKDHQKEQELYATGDPAYAHFGGPLHVKVETTAPPHVAYPRVAAVIQELSKLLQPIKEDTTPENMKAELGLGSTPNDDDDDVDYSVGGPMRHQGGMGRGRGGGGFRGRGGMSGGYGRGGSGPY